MATDVNQTLVSTKAVEFMFVFSMLINFNRTLEQWNNLVVLVDGTRSLDRQYSIWKTMGCVKNILTAVRRLDMFPTGEYLRYKSEPVYRSITGGLISIVILTIFIILFASTALETLNKEIIHSKERIQRQGDPVPSQVTFTPNGGLMFGLMVAGRTGLMLNLSDPNVTVFNFALTHYKMHSDRSVSVDSVPLVTCTSDHADVIGSKDSFYFEGLTEMLLCPQLNRTVQIAGSGSSAERQWMSLTINKCDPSRYTNCISDQDLQALQRQYGGQFRSHITLLASAVNPESSDYIERLVDGRYELSFSTTFGVEVDLYVRQSIVRTDNSISPLKDIVEEKVLSFEDFTVTRQVNTYSNTLMKFNFYKSPLQPTYQRSFQKADEFFSYVGGLIGTIIGLLFILNFYSRQAYSISIASQLYLSEEGQKISSKAFHLGYFFLIPLKRLINMISCCSIKWQSTDFYTRCINQANQQLDVLNMMKKITFLEKSMTLLFTKPQLEALYLFEKEKLNEVESRRKKLEIGKKLNSKTNKVAPQESPSDLQSEQNGPNMTEVIAHLPCNLMRTDEELSVGSISQVNPRSQQRIKAHLKTLMKESMEGNNLSSQVASTINPRLLASMGLRKEDAIVENDSSSSSCRSCSIRQSSKVRFGPSQIFVNQSGKPYRGIEVINLGSMSSNEREEKS